LRFLGIILRLLRLEVSIYKAYITIQFKTTFDQGEGGVVKSIVDVPVNSEFCPNYVQEFGNWTGIRKHGTSLKLVNEKKRSTKE
jgi:hypothetical protein